MTQEFRSLKIACWQVGAHRGDLEANLTALEQRAHEAAAAGAQLLITPEMALTGYNIGDALIELAGAHPLARVQDICRAAGIAILAGGPELMNGPDAGVPVLVNAAWLIDETGEVISKHHKLQLFGDLDRQYFTAGTAPFTIITYRGFTVATLICFDVEYPETVRAASLAGADFIAVPTAQMTPFEFVNEHLIRTRAWENGVYVAYVNQVGSDGDFEYVGRSVIADPFGIHLAQAPATGEALIYATLEQSVIHDARTQNPYLAELRRELF